MRREGYEPAVDGLRAIGIMAVVLYHAGVGAVPGGFVGVDVFFVLSGYLITGLLVREWRETGTISYAGFLERRLRRLAPAFFLVLLATMLAGLFILTPVGGELQGFARSALASATLWVNHHFLHFTGGYFDGPAEQQPLLHLWSLAVEGQFYLLWPLLLWAVLRVYSGGHGALVVAVAGVGLASLLACVLLTPVQGAAAFYLMPTRAWEFAAGGLVVLGVSHGGLFRPAVGGFAIVGLVALAGALLTLDRSMAFPGAWALWPVLATVLLLWAIRTAPQAWPVRLLGVAPLRWLGTRSYAWYLWHWPLLAFWRIEALGHLSLEAGLVLCGVALLLADLTYRFVEQPARSRQWTLTATPRATARSAGLAALAIAVLAVGLGLWAKFVWPSLPGNAAHAAALLGMQKVRVPCHATAPYLGPLPSGDGCEQPAQGPTDAAPTVLLWGDSHAAHLVPGLQQSLRGTGARLLIRYMPECPPLLGFDPVVLGITRPVGCPQFNSDVLEEARRLKEITPNLSLVLNTHWMGYASGELGRSEVAAGLQRTAEALAREGLSVIWVLPAPDMPHDVPACLLRRNRSQCNIGRAQAEAYRQPVVHALQSLQRNVGAAAVALLDPFDSLCDRQQCPAQRGETILYSDSHHLSVAGSLALAEPTRRALRLP